MKLNLGSGQRPKEGWVNVDKYPPADVIHDLESLPWPWADNSASANRRTSFSKLCRSFIGNTSLALHHFKFKDRG
jgi:hypothetical protein